MELRCGAAASLEEGVELWCVAASSLTSSRFESLPLR
jgi:hypothetical protein